jgi:1-deoxy-D-xylulose-5-phosphate reductoisomerase
MGGRVTSSGDPPPTRKRVAVLGSTGSIGRNALAVAAAHPDVFEIVSLSAHRNVELLAEQAARFGVRRVAVGEATPRRPFPDGVAIGRGRLALERLASDPGVDLVVNALVGAAGLAPTMAALRAGRTLALANKESLVMAGELVGRAAEAGGASLVPIDSEHSSLFRCLRGIPRTEVAGVVLTASGGPLRDIPASEIADAGVDAVLDHPTWDMGTKVTVDSATLVNKAMEVVEARWLFGLPFERIDVVLHRESIVHSLVRLVDGSFLAHLGMPDMKVPIQYAMFYPDPPGGRFDDCPPGALGTLHFEPVDFDRYPCYGLVLDAARRGGTSPVIAATADEVAVAAFVDGRIRFGEIADVIAGTLSAVAPGDAPDVDAVLGAEEEAREAAGHVVGRLAAAPSQ